MKDITVLDLADEQGRFCPRLLGDLGAEVVKPKSDLQANDRKELRALIRKSDVLVETFPAGDLESLGFGRPTLRRINPRLIHLSITPFGRNGPRQKYQSSDTVDSAFGGQLYISGSAPGPPREPFRLQSCYTASLFGAVAVLIRLRKRDITGKGSHIDLSIQEAVASTLGNVMTDFFHGGSIAVRGEREHSEGFAILPSSDGSVLITINRSWDTLVELMRADGVAGNLSAGEWQQELYREEHYDEVIAAIGQWTRLHTKHELFELGQAMHFAWAPVLSVEDVLQNPQLKSRNFFKHAVSERVPDAAFPGLPFQVDLGPEPEKSLPPRSGLISKSDCADDEILRGVRVLDLTRMLSGPYATRILADFGAEVIKVQSEKTAQGAERNDTIPFTAWNRNKKSITLDLDSPEAKDALLRLVAASDIVVENFSPRVMANWGLDYPRLREINPRLIMASISAMGQTGPWRDYVGLAPTFHALSGIFSETPAGIGNPYADVIAGLYAALAILAAIESRNRTGRGRHIDLSAYEAICAISMDSRLNAFPRSLICRCKGSDRWCAISLKSDAQVQALRQIVGTPDLVDESVARWTAGQESEAVMQCLQNAGIAAGIVQNAEDLAKDPQLKARRFFVALRHPVLGEVVSDRTPLWDWRRKPKHWKSSPLLGEHNSRYL